jgi:carboxyl-terminal processing protease
MKKILLSIIAAGALLTVGAQRQNFTPDQKLRYAEAIIENYYVDNVNADSLVTEAINAMLKTLDPHSAYSTPKETEDLNQPLEGKFSGIGVQFSIMRDTVCVVQTVSRGPSEKVGILPGDRIIYVNDTLFSHPKMQITDVHKKLRGPKGTVVNLRIKRGASPELINFRIVRDDIPIYSVDASYMVTPEVGYVRISRFAEDTPNEFDRAVERLKKQGMRHIIIDLEDNGGGFLGAAYELSSRLLNKGDLVVYTQDSKGGDAAKLTVEKQYKPGIDRVVVMVNQYSASASEIFSGAMQDHDRGIIVGRRTFGKGLVQRPFPFPDGSMIRLTTSRYYTPAGRCIQKHYQKGQGEEYQLDMLNRYNNGELWSADSIHFDESQRCQTLKKGRTVYGGGGIMPDRFVPVDTSNYSVYYRDLIAKGVITQFCSAYIDSNRKDLLAKYTNEETFSQNFTSTALIDDLVAYGEKEGVPANPEQLATSRKMIEAIVKGLLERDLYENGSYMRSVNPLNPVYNEAVAIITDEKAYNALLNKK